MARPGRRLPCWRTWGRDIGGLSEVFRRFQITSISFTRPLQFASKPFKTFQFVTRNPDLSRAYTRWRRKKQKQEKRRSIFPWSGRPASSDDGGLAAGSKGPGKERSPRRGM